MVLNCSCVLCGPSLTAINPKKTGTLWKFRFFFNLVLKDVYISRYISVFESSGLPYFRDCFILSAGKRDYFDTKKRFMFLFSGVKAQLLNGSFRGIKFIVLDGYQRKF